MRIQNNITAANAHRQYTVNNANTAKAAEKLSSGYRINSAGDDAAGLAISEKMRAQIRGLDMASKNGQDAISLIQTAEGALQETHSMLQRMNELAVQSSTGTGEDFDRAASNAEFEQLKGEIDDIADQTTFNNMKLLDGSLGSGKLLVNLGAGTTTTLAAGMASGGGNLSFTTQIGMSQGKEGAYTLTEGTETDGVFAAGAGGSHLQVSFTDTTGNVTKTTLEFSKIYSASTDATNANTSFTLDLSEAGLGKFGGILTADTTAAAALTELDGLITEVDSFYTESAFGATAVVGITGGALEGVTEKGEISVTRNGADVIFKNTSGETLKTLTISGAAMGVGAAGAREIDLTDVGLGTISYASLAGSTAVGIATDIAAIAKITSGGGTDGGELKVQVGALEGEQLGIQIGKMDSAALGVKSLSIGDIDNAGKAITSTRAAINTVSDQRALLGASANRLQHRINNLNVSSENMQSAESRIRDVDMAKEMTNFTKQGILASAATAMLAQANSAPQNVLQLLRG